MNFLKKLLKRKLVLAIIIVVIIGGGYYGYKTFFIKTAPPSYVTATVAKGTIIVSITGSGQVSASNQIDLTPKAAGDIIYIGVTAGQTVKTGALIAQISATDAYKAVRDAQINLDSAKISLQKLQQPPDSLSLMQSQNALTNAQQAKTNAQNNLKTAYDDAFTAVSNAFLDLPSVITGMQNILHSTGPTSGQDYINYYYDLVANLNRNNNNPIDTAAPYRDSAEAAYLKARADYDKNFTDYNAASRYADTALIDSLLKETYDTTQAMAEAAKSIDNFLSFVNDQLTQNRKSIPTSLPTHQASTASYISKINTNLQNLLSSKNTITDDLNTITDSDLTIKEKTASLAQLEAGTTALDLQSAQLTLKQRQNALADAQQALADYSVRAPFDGTIAIVNSKKSDTVSAGTAIATLVTQQKLATISVNEVDAAKIKVGQKVTLTFDAIDELSISGQIAQIDILGTVSSGVVSYTITINFDTQDSRVLPGMSVNASIITDSKQDVLVAPNSAIKTANGTSYVEILNPPLAQSSGTQGAPSAVPPTQQTVQTGLANDSLTEIISGLKEGDQIVTRTITTAVTATTGSTNILQSLTGGNRGGGSGAARPAALAPTTRGN